jgi:hypothetical protein
MCFRNQYNWDKNVVYTETLYGLVLKRHAANKILISEANNIIISYSGFKPWLLRK